MTAEGEWWCVRCETHNSGTDTCEVCGASRGRSAHQPVRGSTAVPLVPVSAHPTTGEAPPVPDFVAHLPDTRRQRGSVAIGVAVGLAAVVVLIVVIGFVLAGT